MKNKVYLFIIFLLIPITNYALFLTGGSFNYKDENLSASFPLLMRTDQVDKTWHPMNISNLAKKEPGSIQDIQCNASSCLAVGRLCSGDEQQRPLILLSSPEGKNWRVIKEINNFPANKPTGIVYSVSCMNKICLAVGNYYNKYVAHSLPLIIRSKDNGHSWSFVDEIKNIPPDMRHGSLETLHCDDSTCVAVGSYQNSQRDEEILLVSLDNGLHWSYTSLAFPRYYRGTYVTKIQSIAHHYIAVGSYIDNNGRHPLLLRDRGNKWDYIDNIEYDTPRDNPMGEIRDVRCNQQVCVAVGYKNDFAGLLLASNDYGNTWSEKKIKLPADLAVGEIQAVTFVGKTWLAVGYSKLRDNTYVLIVQSDDNGQTWSSIRDVKPESSYEYLETVHCLKSTCVALGRSQNPFILFSKDLGNSWSRVTHFDLPATINRFSLKSVASNKIGLSSSDNL